MSNFGYTHEALNVKGLDPLSNAYETHKLGCQLGGRTPERQMMYSLVVMTHWRLTSLKPCASMVWGWKQRNQHLWCWAWDKETDAHESRESDTGCCLKPRHVLGVDRCFQNSVNKPHNVSHWHWWREGWFQKSFDCSFDLICLESKTGNIVQK